MWFNVHNSLHAKISFNDHYELYRLFARMRIN